VWKNIFEVFKLWIKFQKFFEFLKFLNSTYFKAWVIFNVVNRSLSSLFFWHQMCFIMWVLLRVFCIIDYYFMCCFKGSKTKLKQKTQMDFLFKFLDIHMNKKTIIFHDYYHDLSFGLMTKTKGMERCELKVQPGSHIHIPESVGECERMSPHTPKWIPTLGVQVLMDCQIFKKQFEGSKIIGLKIYL
jgi:hypothetical protein